MSSAQFIELVIPMYPTTGLDARPLVDCLSVALALAGRNLPVLACDPFGKEPLTINGQHLSVYEATTNEDTIRSWWTQCPNANVAIAGGNGLLIVDADTYKNSDALQQLETLIGEALSPTWTETTPRAGLRMLYTVPLLGLDGEPTNYGGRNVCAGAVELRYAGQYALVYPSYVVDSEEGIDGGYARISETTEIMPAQPGLVALLAPSTAVSDLPDAELLPTGAYFTSFYQDAIAEQAVVGLRSDRAHWFMNRCAEHGLSLGQIITAVWQYPPALAKEAEHRGWITADLKRFQRNDWPKFEKPVATGTQAQVINLDDFLESEDPEYDWLVPQLWERFDRTIITGGEGGGKSTLGRQVAVSTAAGLHPFTFKPLPEPLRVVLVDLENPETLLRRELRKLRANVDKADLGVISVPEGLNLASDKDDQKYLIEQLKHHPADLLVIGPLYKMAAEDLKDEKICRPLAQFLDRLRFEFGCALWIEAHQVHAPPGFSRPTRPYGSTLWMRWPEFGLHLAKDGALKHYRNPRDVRDWPEQLVRGGIWPWMVGSAVMNSGNERMKAICDFLASCDGWNFPHGKGKLLNNIKGFDNTLLGDDLDYLANREEYVKVDKTSKAWSYTLIKLWDQP